MLDQSAAYDLLDHPILLKKLEVYNFREESIQWIGSYLSNRSQSVQVEARQSKVFQLEDHAAPQGSLLGGLLFLINENDFPACRDQGESVLLVDDDTDVVSDDEVGPLLQKIQLEADLSCAWLRDNRMVVAGEKSKLLIIRTKELRKKKLGDEMHSIMVDGKLVRESKSEKLLGVIINNQMTWQEHLYGEDWRTEEDNNPGLIPQLSQRFGILRKLAQHSSKKTLKMLTAGLFYSKLSYCLPLYTNTWGLDNYKEDMQRFTSYTKEDNRKLQVIQNQVSRLLVDKKVGYYKQDLPTSELLDMTDALSIHQLGVQRTLVMVKKVLLTEKPRYLFNNLKIQAYKGTRSGSTMEPIKASLNLKRSSFLYRGAKLFNQIPENLKNEKKITTFKKELEKWVKKKIPVKP